MREMIEVSAPAKINLFLHIVGRRDDGYHLLESLFAFTQHGDVIRISEAEHLSFNITGPFADVLTSAGGDQENLVVQAAQAFAKEVGREANLEIELEKNLPVAAGIGGGSADAAATLIALNEYWKCGFERKHLEDIALTLGADVPACLYPHPLYVTGIGENVEQVSLPKPYTVLLVNPGVGVSTPEIFKAFHASGDDFDTSIGSSTAFEGEKFEPFLFEQSQNTLQKPAEKLCVEVSRVLEKLTSLNTADYVAMSGSGATCFALFSDLNVAKDAEQIIRMYDRNWWTMVDQLYP
ncbi:4-(cytidine 5'-diphospho)-2-C-methyl-D-erythritol kinase [Kordiimonas sp. SCSIO 12603]|uniref:4-(cytidine 5'-diphospho)-2-C-methyl-D-erythritol kinase n=1 Tax=Kordiimonas sp. SCSIO 12603 TaxID=2829596 RepID=UPI0021021A3C|nr:4-(cytidine 5'-diphospho)-2-C-methyl-D-erythritol kinase [Kordiimonas sp. SCSIO 12603]UTW57946.1 4-(cytidine 5'-diphospho)-2-C-methyl-D-erythritol kinase [Kordiimonas sp. SCSIO 12603]